MSTADHIAAIKSNKSTRWVLSNSWFNHPHRLASIDTSGSLSYTIDERDFTSPGTSAKVYEFSLNFASANGYTRLFEDKYPWRINTVSIGTPPGGAPSSGEFYMGHRPRRMWEAQTNIGTADYATIGTCTETPYTRPTTSDPWVAGSATTTDVDFRFVLFISKGGEPDSQGKGDGSDDEKIEIQFQDQYTGTNTLKLPNLASVDPHILRLPWNDSWASETSIFATAFSDHLTSENTSDGGGHTGSCSLSLDFT